MTNAVAALYNLERYATVDVSRGNSNLKLAFHSIPPSSFILYCLWQQEEQIIEWILSRMRFDLEGVFACHVRFLMIFLTVFGRHHLDQVTLKANRSLLISSSSSATVQIFRERLKVVI